MTCLGNTILPNFNDRQVRIARGVLVDQFVENTYQTGDYTYSWSIRFLIIGSDLWVVPEFSAWTSILLILFILTVAIAFYKGRLETPNH